MQTAASRNMKQETTPLTEPVFLILLSLAQAPRHGYALLKDTEALSDGRVRLSTGTLYGVLHRLLESKWIDRFETDDTSREKQSYRLTSQGRKYLHAELARMKQLTRVATACLKSREA
jgi:DNA-binding PadR family transcriptional regulator